MRLRWANAGRLAVTCLWLIGSSGHASAESSLIEVDMQLVLAVDISFSISLDEQDIQRRGYIAAFRDPEVISAITSGYRGRIAVTYLEWAGEDHQSQVVAWTLITDPVSAADFAKRLEMAPVTRKGRTSLSQALTKALGLFRQSPFQSNRHVVDLSSDGFNNSGPRVNRARDALVYHGVTINGLPLVQGHDTGPKTGPEAGPKTGPKTDLRRYFQDCVIGGLGAFVMPAAHWDEFAETLKNKLVSEISGPWQSPAMARVTHAADKDAAPSGMDCLIGEKEDLKEYIRQLEKAVGKGRAPRWMPREQDWPMPD